MLATLAGALAAPKIQVTGHRGARTVLPENTLAGFDYALKAGADVVELDVAVTKDGVAVVSHDALINNKICRGPEGERAIRKLTLAEVKQWDCGAIQNADFPRQKTMPGQKIPTLDEALALVRKHRNGWVNIEIKLDANKPELSVAPDEFARLVVESIRRNKMEKRVIVQSFNFAPVRETKRLAPELMRSALYAGLPKDFVKIAAEAGSTEIVAPHFSLVTADQVAAAHAAGLKVIPWTANTVEQWDKLIEAGVDGIITDDPAALISHLKSKGLR